MTYYKNPNMNKKNLKRLLKSLLLLVPIALTSCCVSKENKPSMRIYQTPTLKLEAGTEVKTVDGIYIPQVPEIWYSESKYLEMVSIATKRYDVR